MFKELINGKPHKIGKHNNTLYNYTVIDDDFNETVYSNSGLADIVIQVYEPRNLPVVSNMIRAIIWWHKKSHYSLKEITDSIKKNYPQYAKYADEVDRYLMLL